MMVHISICICTRRRQEGLKKLLHSLNEMQSPSDTGIEIIVVENDLENHSENIIMEFSAISRFRVSYYLESRKGLAYARNRSVKEAGDCDFCCFVDDDQVVHSKWIAELLRCQKEFNADGVWGPNPPLFNRDVPDYIRKFYTPETYDYGTVVHKAATNCLLLRKMFLDSINGPFDIRLNFSGGEDGHLTSLVSGKGGIIRFNPDAIAYEIIPDNRTTIKYVLKRTYRISNTELLVKSLIENEFSRFKTIPRIIMRFSYGLLILIPYLIFGKYEKIKGLIKIVYAIGGLLFIIGNKNQLYK